MSRRVAGLVCLLLAIGIAITGLFLFGPRLKDYHDAKNSYEDIRKYAILSPETSEEPNEQTETNAADKARTSETESPIMECTEKTLDAKNTVTYKVPAVDGKYLKTQNPDYLGWIYISGTSISYPVVMSNDNEDYLHTGFDKNYLFAGTLFMDCRCYDGYFNKHSIIYGHNMIDGSMFAALNKYDQAFWKEHPVFWFITPEYKLMYKIFSVTTNSSSDETVYDVYYDDITDFKNHMDTISDMSNFPTGIHPLAEHYVMTLSTCTGESDVRTCIHGILAGEYKG